MSLWSVFSVSQQLKSNLACFSNPKVTCSHNVVVAEKLITWHLSVTTRSLAIQSWQWSLFFS